MHRLAAHRDSIRNSSRVVWPECDEKYRGREYLRKGEITEHRKITDLCQSYSTAAVVWWLTGKESIDFTITGSTLSHEPSPPMKSCLIGTPPSGPHKVDFPGISVSKYSIIGRPSSRCTSQTPLKRLPCHPVSSEFHTNRIFFFYHSIRPTRSLWVPEMNKSETQKVLRHSTKHKLNDRSWIHKLDITNATKYTHTHTYRRKRHTITYTQFEFDQSRLSPVG